MDAQNILQTISDRLHSTATVKSVFGDPIRLNDKIVVPVAKVAYGFGAGFGSGPGTRGDQARSLGEGGGGGGGVRATPAGVLEITSNSTRFVPLHDRAWIAAAVGAGLLIGTVLGRRRIRGA